MHDADPKLDLSGGQPWTSSLRYQNNHCRRHPLNHCRLRQDNDYLHQGDFHSPVLCLLQLLIRGLDQLQLPGFGSST